MIIGYETFLRVSQSWDDDACRKWLTEGLSELANPSGNAVPFAPLVLRPSDEPLGQLHVTIEEAPGKVRALVRSALRSVLASLSPDLPPRYCDLAWRLAAGLRPPGGLIAEARLLLTFPTFDTRREEWAECLRSMMRAVLSYARTPELDEFFEDLRESRHWQPRFAWRYGIYLVKLEPRQWLHFIRQYLPDIENYRKSSREAHLRQLRRLLEHVGATRVAKDYAEIYADHRLKDLFGDMIAGQDPILRIESDGEGFFAEIAGKKALLSIPLPKNEQPGDGGESKEEAELALQYALSRQKRPTLAQADEAQRKVGSTAVTDLNEYKRRRYG